MKGKLLAAGGALVAGLGFSKLINDTKEALTEFDALAKQADTTGLGTDFYQTMQLAAEEAGVAQNTLNSVMIAFVKSVGEAKAGIGPLVGGLKVLDGELLAAIKSADNQEDALRIVADALQNAKTATDRARIANAAFSGSGIVMERVLKQGSAGLDETAAKARRLGIIIEESLLRTSEKLANDYGVAAMSIDRQFKRSLIDLAPWIVSSADAVAGLARALPALSEAGRDVGDMSTMGLGRELQKLRALSQSENEALYRLDTAIADRRARGLDATDQQIQQRAYQAERLAEANAELVKAEMRADELASGGKTPAASAAALPETGGTSVPSVNAPTSVTDVRARIAEERAAALGELEALRRRMLGETGRTRDLMAIEHADELGRFQTMLNKKLISAEQFEQARQHLATITKGEVEKLMTDELAALQQGVDVVTGHMQSAFDEFFETGKINGKAFVASMLKDFARLTFTQATQQGGSVLTSILGSLFSMRATGGSVMAGKPYIVGERGPELMVPGHSGSVVPSARMGDLSAGGVTIDARTYIDAPGADAGALATLRAEMARRDAELPAKIIATFNDARARGLTA
jgi:hypothetical protein